VIGGDEDFVSDGERRAQGAAAGLEAVELVLEIAALGSCRGDRGADQDGAEVDVAAPVGVASTSSVHTGCRTRACSARCTPTGSPAIARR
jgi:hypothetical protein